MDSKEIQKIKLRFGIVGNAEGLNRAIDIAMQVAPTDLSVLVTGESGVGKENIPRVIHQHSLRRNAKYFAINCGAIPEGTIDSELFGHEKGSFTGANEMRRGYFEEADGGTIFLDEIAELPMASQAKLLRVLQSGEFIRVGSSKVLRTDVRVIAATNVDLMHAVSKGKFRADLYYRLNAVVIPMPALRERPGDINVLFRKFASDFSSKYGICKVSLTEDASILLRKYRWPGNIRQLKNVAESVSALESVKISGMSDKCIIDVDVLSRYIPKEEPNLLPATVAGSDEAYENPKERAAILRMLYSLKQEVDYLKEVVAAMGGTQMPSVPTLAPPQAYMAPEREIEEEVEAPEEQEFDVEDVTVDDLSIRTMSKGLIEKVLKKHGGNRKAAAAELGISERTLYRKIKAMNLE